ncbi:MAG: hypothetical protein ACO3TP_10480, partial [Ilumatobacteraceae bacterium]
MILLPLLASVVPLVPVPVDTAPVDAVPVETEPSCAAYSIEGSLDSMPISSRLDPMAADLEIS